MRQVLDMIEVYPKFDHQWFRGQPSVSFWAFFDKYNKESEKKEQALNVKKFFVRYVPPQIPNTEGNTKLL